MTTILLLSNSQQIRRQVKEALSPRKVTARKVTTKSMPTRADAVVSKAALNASTEFLAMRLKCSFHVFVFPEAVAALEELVKSGRLPLEGDTITLAGADIAKFDPMSRAAQQNTEQDIIL